MLISNLIFLNGVITVGVCPCYNNNCNFVKYIIFLCYNRDESFEFFLDIVMNRLLGKLIKGKIINIYEHPKIINTIHILSVVF